MSHTKPLRSASRAPVAVKRATTRESPKTRSGLTVTSTSGHLSSHIFGVLRPIFIVERPIERSFCQPHVSASQNAVKWRTCPSNENHCLCDVIHTLGCQDEMGSYYARPPFEPYLRCSTTNFRSWTADRNFLSATRQCLSEHRQMACAYVKCKSLCGWRHTLGCKNEMGSSEPYILSRIAGPGEPFSSDFQACTQSPRWATRCSFGLVSCSCHAAPGTAVRKRALPVASSSLSEQRRTWLIFFNLPSRSKSFKTINANQKLLDDDVEKRKKKTWSTCGGRSRLPPSIDHRSRQPRSLQVSFQICCVWFI